jgi:hypothetical protein
MTAVGAAIKDDDMLSLSLDIIIYHLRTNPWGQNGTVETPLGIHGVVYDHDGEGDYAVIGMVLGGSSMNSDVQVFAEIEDGTYGQMQGYRIFREDLS